MTIARDVLKAKADLAEAKAAYEKCQRICAEHAALSPLDVAFADGAASGFMQTSTEIHWNNFLHVFGQIDGARARFDEGKKHAILQRQQKSVPYMSSLEKFNRKFLFCMRVISWFSFATAAVKVIEVLTKMSPVHSTSSAAGVTCLFLGLVTSALSRGQFEDESEIVLRIGFLVMTMTLIFLLSPYGLI